MKNVTVIGAGTMGNGIAHTFAQCGYNVNLIDISQAAIDRGMATISKNLDRMVAKEKISEADKTRTLSNITTYTSVKEGVQYASLVVEAATENDNLKAKMFSLEFNSILQKVFIGESWKSLGNAKKLSNAPLLFSIYPELRLFT